MVEGKLGRVKRRCNMPLSISQWGSLFRCAWTSSSASFTSSAGIASSSRNHSKYLYSLLDEKILALIIRSEFASLQQVFMFRQGYLNRVGKSHVHTACSHRS